MSRHDLAERDLRRLRSWRLWLLGIVALGQGAQYVLNPSLPLTARAFQPLRPWGPHGWMCVGMLLVCVGICLLVASPSIRWLGNLVGAATYFALGIASALAGVAPFVLLLPIGLHLGEVRARAWTRGNQPHRTRGRGE